MYTKFQCGWLPGKQCVNPARRLEHFARQHRSGWWVGRFRRRGEGAWQLYTRKDIVASRSVCSIRLWWWFHMGIAYRSPKAVNSTSSILYPLNTLVLRRQQQQQQLQQQEAGWATLLQRHAWANLIAANCSTISLALELLHTRELRAPPAYTGYAIWIGMMLGPGMRNYGGDLIWLLVWSRLHWHGSRTPNKKKQSVLLCGLQTSDKLVKNFTFPVSHKTKFNKHKLVSNSTCFSSNERVYLISY